MFRKLMCLAVLAAGCLLAAPQESQAWHRGCGGGFARPARVGVGYGYAAPVSRRAYYAPAYGGGYYGGPGYYGPGFGRSGVSVSVGRGFGGGWYGW